MTRKILWLLAIAWTLSVLIGSFLPGEVKKRAGTYVEIPEQGQAVQVNWTWHQTMHLGMFILTGTLYLALARTRRETLAAILAALVLAVAIEILQYYVFELIAFEWWDIRDDAIGLLLAGIGKYAYRLLK